jgi:glycosyltransferase involved in cell wall biosynthesis
MPVPQTKTTISVIIPAWNEAERIGATLRQLDLLRRHQTVHEIIVVDDGSDDDGWRKAEPYADRIIRHARRRGKGAALDTGWREAKGQIVVFLDADLGESAIHASRLIRPVEEDAVDMTIAKLPPSARRGGFGLVKRLAVNGIYRLSGFRAEAPLSGQRAMKRQVLENIGGLPLGFGIEVGLTIDAVRLGYRVLELDVPFSHRETGRDWQGFLHRGKQFWHVGRTLMHKWRHPV